MIPMEDRKEPVTVPDESPDSYNAMPPGLSGYWWETEHLICVPLVVSHREGAFSQFLRDIESKGKAVFFPSIVNPRLDAILRARGYVDAGIPTKSHGFVDGLALIRKEGQ